MTRYIDDHRAAGGEGAHGLVSSVTQALDALWPNYNRDQGIPFKDLHKRIDCWDIPTDSNRWVFWSEGWGAPHRVMLNAMKMVSLHFDEIKDDYTGKCDSSGGDEGAFGQFILGLLYGLRLPNDRGDGTPCELSLNVATKGTFHSAIAQWGCDDEDGGTNCISKECADIGSDYQERDLGIFEDPECQFSDWDDWDVPRWDSRSRIWLPGNSGDPWPKLCAFKALQFGGTAITFSPPWVAWIGYLCDWLMFEARMAYDYYRDTGKAAYYTSATQMARYAQRLIAQIGVVLIHEIGHSWAGAQHCSAEIECCFEVAAYRWLTAIQARFGLPMQVWTTFDGGDVYGFGDYLEHNPRLQRQYWQVEGCGREDRTWGYVAKFADPTELYSAVEYCAMTACYKVPPSCILRSV